MIRKVDPDHPWWIFGEIGRLGWLWHDDGLMIFWSRVVKVNWRWRRRPVAWNRNHQEGGDPDECQYRVEK